jgi:hypothetical protein
LGYGRWASYRLPDKLVRFGRDAPDDTETPQDSPQHNGGSHQHTVALLDGAKLLAIAAPARAKARLAPAKMRGLIRRLCQVQSLTVSQIDGLLNRHPEGIRNRFLSEMVREGAVLARYPDPAHPEQAYRAKSRVGTDTIADSTTSRRSMKYVPFPAQG